MLQNKMQYEEQYFKKCESLKEIIEDTGEPLEGNCVYKHLTFEKWDVLQNKRINYQTAAKEKSTICEIGFNGGHSVLAMILSNPNATYVLFDIGTHSYAKPCFQYIKESFPNTQIDIIWGNSIETVPQFIQDNPSIKFDLVHIDGSHKSEIYKQDWLNTLSIVKEGGLIIFDDTDNVKINDFINEEIQKGVVSEVFQNYLATSGYEHRILSKI